MDNVNICERIRDAKAGEWIDLFGDGHFYGLVTNRYVYFPEDPMGPVYRDVVWIDPPYGPPCTGHWHRNNGFCVYRTRQEMKAHLGDNAHVEVYREA